MSKKKAKEKTTANKKKDHKPLEFPLEDSMAYLIRDTHRLVIKVFEPMILKHGVSMGQWFFLRALWKKDGQTQRELSNQVRMREPTTVTALNSMEKAGFVKRVRNTEDRRKINIFLTRKGRSLGKKLIPFALEINQIIGTGIPPEEIQQCRRILEQMKINLEKENEKP